MRRFWTVPEIRRFRARYPRATVRDLMTEFNRTRFAVRMMAVKLGLGKSPAFVPVRFPEGHTPWNRGRKGWQPGGRAKATQFKKGQRGARQRPVGAERQGRDGMEVKVAEPRAWMSKARFVWERDAGPIPAGFIVRLLNRSAPITLSNLVLVTRAENLRLNYRPRRAKAISPLWSQLVVMAA